MAINPHFLCGLLAVIAEVWRTKIVKGGRERTLKLVPPTLKGAINRVDDLVEMFGS